jgi:hypothetical protein
MAAPAGATLAPLGVIVQADRASVGNDPAAVGATVFDGETLHTDISGLLRVRFGMSQAYFLPRSQAMVHQTDGGFAADLAAGTVVLSAAEGETFRLLADGALIRPGTTQATVAQITVVSPTELLLTSRKGTLQVSMDDEAKTVPEGASYRMLIQPDPVSGPGPGPAGAGGGQLPSPTGQNHFVFVVAGVAAVAAGVGIYLAVRSPSTP